MKKNVLSCTMTLQPLLLHVMGAGIVRKVETEFGVQRVSYSGVTRTKAARKYATQLSWIQATTFPSKIPEEKDST